MPDDRRTKALARLQQLQRLQALAAQRQAAAARASAATYERQIACVEERVTAEAAAITDYTDIPALGRWADLMDSRRDGLVRRKAAEQQRADLLARKAAAAQLTVEQHAELLNHLRKRLQAERQREASRAEWESAATLTGWKRDDA
jgi:hypothetical protein